MKHTRFKLGFAYKEGKTSYFKEYYEEFKDDIDPVSVADDTEVDKLIYANEKAFIESKIKAVAVEPEAPTEKP